MSSGHYAVQTEELEDVVARVARFEENLLAAIETADAKVNRLHGVWSGAAADAHRERHTRWRRDAATMHEALGVMRQIAGTAHQNYLAVNAANAQMWDQV